MYSGHVWPVKDVDQCVVVLQLVFLQHGALDKVHVAHGDGRKVEVFERRRQRVHVCGHGQPHKIPDGSINEHECRRDRD